MDLALLLFLILLNGAFAMSEMALTAARKARLQVMIANGESGAEAAMALHEHPTRFLSTVQIGITSIGVLNGIVGEAAFAEPLSAWIIATFGIQERIARLSATGLVVVIITFLTIIFGELVPKRLGQMFPEEISRLVARPMNWLSTATRPFVALLGACTDTMLKLLGLGNRPTRAVTEEEIAAQLEEGLDAGVLDEQEHQMVRNVFRLDERQIGSMMVPRAEVAWIDAQGRIEDALAVMAEHQHSRYPVGNGSLDHVVGVLPAHRWIAPLAAGKAFSLTDHLEAPVFVPETLTGMELLDHLRQATTDVVFVVDEYGAVQGLITERDVLEAITGEFAAPADDDAWAVQRGDGSWLMDGLIPVPEMKDRLDIRNLPDEDRGRYNTLAGMIMLLLGRLPATTDAVEWDGWRFEVVDLDGHRVDKVLVQKLPESQGENA
jgi:putative hemolysin